MRFLVYLKYLPLLLIAALVGIWAVSVFFHFGYRSNYVEVVISEGGIYSDFFDNVPIPTDTRWYFEPQPNLDGIPLGRLHLSRHIDTYFSPPGQPTTVISICCPLSCLVTGLLPLAVGAWTRFRFRLWMYFAWTALVAVQCAYFAVWIDM